MARVSLQVAATVMFITKSRVEVKTNGDNIRNARKRHFVSIQFSLCALLLHIHSDQSNQYYHFNIRYAEFQRLAAKQRLLPWHGERLGYLCPSQR